MRRRTLLRALPAGAAALAGCLSRLPAGDDVVEPTTTAPSPSPTDTPPADAPPCPDLGNGAPTVCAAGDAPAAALFGVDVADDSLPTAAATFVLSNPTDGRLGSNFYGWQLYKHHAGAWVHVTPRPVPEPLMTLEPGASHAWSLAVDNTTLGTDAEAVDTGGTEDLPISGLGPGHYAFAVTVFGQPDDGTGTPAAATRTPTRTAAGTDTPTATPTATPVEIPDTVVLAARFRLTGEAPALVAAPDVEIEDEADGTLTASSESGRKADSPTTVVAERAPDAAAEARTIPLELAYRTHGVRNTVPLFEPDVDRVELRTANYVGLVPFQSDPGHATVRGRTYRFTVQDE